MTMRTAVVGVGTSGSAGHLPALDRNPRTSLVGVCDIDEERVREAGANYGAVPYTDTEKMFTEEHIDWVHICTPVQTHIDIGLEAIESGCHVLIQKPIAVTSDEVETLSDAADEAGVQLSVVHNQAFFDTVRNVRAEVQQGTLGEIRSVEVVFSGEGAPDETPRGQWVFDLPGGELEEGLPHPIYLALILGGYPADRSDVEADTRLQNEYSEDIAYDGMQVQYTSVDGALCTVKILSGGPPTERVFVHGDDASLTIDLISMNVTRRASGEGRSPVDIVKRTLGDSVSSMLGLGLNMVNFAQMKAQKKLDRHDEDSFSGTYYQINESAKAIERGTEPPVPIAEALWTTYIIEAVRTAAE